WSINSPDAGRVGFVKLGFSHIGSLTGGTGADTFTIAGGATLSGAIDGGGGANTIDWSLFSSSALNVTLTGPGASGGFDGKEVSTGLVFADIEDIVGGSSTTTTDTLTGMDAPANWTLGRQGETYASGGNVLTFSGFEQLDGGASQDNFTIAGDHNVSLSGGAGDDSFRFQDEASSISGSIDGGAGNDK